MDTTIRAQWPHTIQDIRKSLDGIWGVVGAVGPNGNLLRLERSFDQPTTYKLTEYRGTEEENILSAKTYTIDEKESAINSFAKLLGF